MKFRRKRRGNHSKNHRESIREVRELSSSLLAKFHSLAAAIPQKLHEQAQATWRPSSGFQELLL